MSGFYIEVDKEDLKYINKKFQFAQNNTTRVLRNAINQTATVAMRTIKRGRAAGYTINAPAFNSEVEIQRANAAHLDATIKSHGKTRTIQQFKLKSTGNGHKADVTKTGLKKLVNAAGANTFVGTGGKTKGLIVQRETKNPYPLRVIVSNSVPKMVEQIYKGERGGQGDMQEKIQQTLHDKIREQVEKLL